MPFLLIFFYCLLIDDVRSLFSSMYTDDFFLFIGFLELVWRYCHDGTPLADEFGQRKKKVYQKFLWKISGHRKEKFRRWWRRVTGIPEWHVEEKKKRGK